MMEYWNTLLTEKSWVLLQEIRKKYQFVLIGGWAIYLWARRQKSKDIDIVVSIEELQKLKQENLAKNDHLKKYGIKKDEIDIDIYVAHYSELVIPAKDMQIYAAKVEGFDVAVPEALLILKQNAEMNRRGSVKGEKDKIDVMSLLFFVKIDYRKYNSVLKKYKLEYVDNLMDLVRGFQDYHALGLNPREFKLKKMEIIKSLRKLK